MSDWWSRNQRKVIPYIFLAPFLLSFAVFTVYPAGTALYLSFQRTRGFLPAEEGGGVVLEFKGWANFERLLTKDKRFRTAMINGAEFWAGYLARADAAGAGYCLALELAPCPLQGTGAISFLRALHHLGGRRRLDI